MERKARVEIQREHNQCLLTISGLIDESFDQSFLKELPQGSTIVLNLKAVSRINSMGMVLWRNVMREMSRLSDNIYVQECSPMMITQTSMIHGFMGHAIILSICVPYVCEACGADRDMICKTNEIQVSPALACDKCGGEMVLDDAPEIYLQIPADNRPS